MVKKIAPGLSENSGDVNLFGYESPNLQSLKHERQQELELTDTLLKTFTGTKSDVASVISETVLVISNRIESQRRRVVSQTYHLKKT